MRYINVPTAGWYYWLDIVRDFIREDLYTIAFRRDIAEIKQLTGIKKKKVKSYFYSVDEIFDVALDYGYTKKSNI